MRLLIALVPLYLVGQSPSPAAKPFPEPDFILHDSHHKEPASGVQLGPNGITIQTGVGTPTTINVLGFSGDGKHLAAGKDFGRVVVWDIQNRKVVRAVDTGQGIVSAVALNGDGTTLATGGNGDKFSVKLWNVTSGKLVKTFKLGNDFVKDLRFDPSGKWLVAIFNQGNAYVIDSATVSPVFQLKQIHAMRFFENGGSLLTGDANEFSTWNTADWSKKRTIPRWQGSPLLLADDAGRDRMAVYQFSDGGIHLYRLSNGDAVDLSRLQLPKQRTTIPKFVQFSPDGAYLYGNIDGRMWRSDARTNGACGSNLMYSEAGALSPDGRWLVGSKDDSIFSKERTDGVWVWNTEKLGTACGVTPSAR